MFKGTESFMVCKSDSNIIADYKEIKNKLTTLGYKVEAEHSKFFIQHEGEKEEEKMVRAVETVDQLFAFYLAVKFERQIAE